MTPTEFENKELEFAYRFHNQMREQELMLAYEGDISQQLTKAFSAMAEDALEKNNEDEKVKRRLFHVMVESLQNLSKHSDNPSTGESARPGTGIFLVGRCAQCYMVTTGNVTSNSKLDFLKEMLDTINSMTPEELKAFYKTKLKENRLSDKGGAGLGFIDMARKTGSKVEYHFVPINDLVSFFLYRITIQRKN